MAEMALLTWQRLFKRPDFKALLILEKYSIYSACLNRISAAAAAARRLGGIYGGLSELSPSVAFIIASRWPS